MTRRRYRSLAAGLVVYGVTGLVLAVVGLLLAVQFNARVDQLASGVTERVASIEQTLHSTATALDKAATTTDSFAVTLERTAPVLDQAIATLGSSADTMRSAASASANLSILGQQPLAGLGASLSSTADQIDQLAGQLGGVSEALTANRVALGELAASLRALSADVEATA
ncbi:MAG: hypothetical protein ACXVSE_19225, partial [Solirubrobacteraceae bacterium]